MTANRYFKPDDPAVKTPLEIPPGACADPYQLAWVAQWLGAPDIVDVGGGAGAVHWLAASQGSRIETRSLEELGSLGRPLYRALLLDPAGELEDTFREVGEALSHQGLLVASSARWNLQDAVDVASRYGMRPQGEVDSTSPGEGGTAWRCVFVRASDGERVPAPDHLRAPVAAAAGSAGPDGIPRGPSGSAPRPLRARKLPRVLLVTDVRGWAFDVNLMDLAQALGEHYVFDFWCLTDGDALPDLSAYDAIFCPYHRWPVLDRMPADRTLGSLRSRWFRQEDPRPPTPDEVALVQRFAGFHVVTKDVEVELLRAGVRGWDDGGPLIYLTNPVATERFDAPLLVGVEDPLVASWNGHAGREGDQKGYWSVVVPACRLAGVELRSVGYGTPGGVLGYQEMPGFYRGAHVALCASAYEGGSNSVMEAMAAGQALISTDCGNVRELRESQMRHLGQTGIVLVERSAEAFAEALRDLSGRPEAVKEMGEANRREIRERWSWRVWAGRYKEFIDRAARPAAASRSAEGGPSLLTYADTAGWAQDHFVRDLTAQARRLWGWSARATNDMREAVGQAHGGFYSPCCGAADTVMSHSGLRGSTGLWSHVSYGGWASHEPLKEDLLPKVKAHATNLYLHGLTGLPYLAAGVDTRLFRPPVGEESRRQRHARDRRIVVGWTGSLQYNATLKLFADLWLPAVRLAGSDGPLAEATFCARPLVVWDCRDARTPSQVAEYLRGIDIYLCTSISEGCSLSVLEAAASGCLVISTPCGNAPELADSVVGWGVEEIASLLRAYASNKDGLYEAQERLRERVEAWWSWDSPMKAEAWRAWLGSGAMPSWQEQVPYVERTPALWLWRAALLWSASHLPLRSGDMHRS